MTDEEMYVELLQLGSLPRFHIQATLCELRYRVATQTGESEEDTQNRCESLALEIHLKREGRRL